MSGMTERFEKITKLEAELQVAMQRFAPMFDFAQSEDEVPSTLSSRLVLVKNRMTFFLEEGLKYAKEILNNPSPLPYEEHFLATWKKAQCYWQTYIKWKTGKEAPDLLAPKPSSGMTVTPGTTVEKLVQETKPPVTETIPTPTPPAPLLSQPVIVADEGDDVETVETTETQTETSPIVKWGLLAFVGFLGYRVIKGK